MLLPSTSEDTNIISSSQKITALIGAFIVAFGFIPIPLTDQSLPQATWFEWLIAVLPLLPLAILTLSLVFHRRIPLVFGAALAFWVLCAGAIVALAMMALSGGGKELVILHGTALTLACVTSVLFISRIGQKARQITLGIYAFPVLVGVWSLAMAPLAYSSAIKISSSRAFCIGEHSPITKELSSLFGLRGLSSYTTRSGYKIGDTWYFHGLLLVEDDGDTLVFNWSPRNMEFQAVERPRLLFANPFDACEPRKNFFQKLSLF